MTRRLAQDDDDQSPAWWDKQRFGIQVILSGLQDTQVVARSASAAGMNHGMIAVRLGRVLLYLEDRDALLSLTAALAQAGKLQDEAFGTHSAVYRPRPVRARAG